jgi:Cu-processing system permease protein
MNRIIKIILSDILKNKIVLVYTLILAVLSWSSFGMEDNTAKGMLTILNVILFTVPLVSILFATIYIYNSAEFIELLVSQPIKRSKIWISLFISLSLSLIISFLIGSGIPLLINAPRFERYYDVAYWGFNHGYFCFFSIFLVLFLIETKPEGLVLQ